MDLHATNMFLVSVFAVTVMNFARCDEDRFQWTEFVVFGRISLILRCSLLLHFLRNCRPRASLLHLSDDQHSYGSWFFYNDVDRVLDCMPFDDLGVSV
jgi:hypothetical protein